MHEVFGARGREMALRLGASSAVPSEGCTAQLKQNLGKGCELVFDCAGTEQFPGSENMLR